MKQMIVRPAMQDDIAPIAAIERLCFSSPWSESAVKSEIEKENAVFLVCDINGAVSGYVSMETVLDECYVGNLAVHPSFRRSGVASALLEALRMRAQEINCAFISLEVRASNTAARTLYEKYGYTFQGIRPAFYSDPTEDAVIYTLFLREVNSL